MDYYGQSGMIRDQKEVYKPIHASKDKYRWVRKPKKSLKFKFKFDRINFKGLNKIRNVVITFPSFIL